MVATFFNNIANDLPITLNDPTVQLELLHIDDLVEEMLDSLEGKAHCYTFDSIETVLCEDSQYCAAPVTHKVTLGEILELLLGFNIQSRTLVMSEIPEGSFAKKWYSTYLSYLPKEKVSFALKMNKDERGSFAKLMKTEKCGQFSVMWANERFDRAPGRRSFVWLRSSRNARSTLIPFWPTLVRTTIIT